MLLFFVFKVVYNSEQVQGPFKVNQKQLFSSSGLETFISNPKKAIFLFTLTGPNVNVVYCTNRDSSPQDLSYFVHNSGSLSYCCKALQLVYAAAPRRAASATAATPRCPVRRRERAESDTVLATLKHIFKPLLKGKTFSDMHYTKQIKLKTSLKCLNPREQAKQGWYLHYTVCFRSFHKQQ